LQFIVTGLNGLSLASILIMIAIGLAVIFGLLRVINLAHGDFFMAGMYSVVAVEGVAHNFWLGVVAAVVVVGVIGLAVERGLIRWLRDRPLDTLLATWGVGIVVREVVRLIFGGGFRQVANPLPGEVSLGSVGYPTYRLLLIVLTGMLLLAVSAWLYRTRSGLRLRAMLEDSPTAAAFGIDQRRMTTLAFVVGASLAGLAGALMAPLVTVSPDAGLIFLARAFLVVVVGGVGTILGLLGGGVLIGGGGALTGFILSPTNAEAVILLIAIVILRLRPSGLFGQSGRNG
jgi:urea transport system permease protein